MANLAIVAIPKKDELVYKISSEKIPHLTLLFLGDLSNIKNLDEIINVTKHYTNKNLTQFGLEVEYRGILGPGSADVLFFSKSKFSGFDIINTFRETLLQNNVIRDAYNSIEQFPEWTPHLTLGYPETPAKSYNPYGPAHNLNELLINYVEFDHIAVWDKDYSGVDFYLQPYNFKEGLRHAIAHAGIYDPVKAHEYYIRTRHLKGRHRGSHTTKYQPHPRKSTVYTVTSPTGHTYKLSASQLAEQQAYAAMRVAKITSRLKELGDKLKAAMTKAQQQSAHNKKPITSAARLRRQQQSKKYQQRHKATLAVKAKTRAKILGSNKRKSSTKDPVAALEGKITEVRNHLKAAVATQRALASARQIG